MRESFASGTRAGVANTGGSSTMGTIGSGEAANDRAASQAASESGPPAWAQRVKRNQAVIHGAQTAAQALKSGDSHGGGHSVDLSQGE
jgi:type IV secretion system protein TrbL